jgi:DNA invertase Pin-like site-specific DNA recombinase
MKKCKATAVYARTSSKKQNFVLQIEAASPHLKGIEPEGLFYFVDEGVSGFSKPVDLLKLIDLIKNDEISTLVVYDRKRLVTSLDIYLQLINLIEMHKVKVIFTATDEEEFGDIYAEGVKGLIIKYESIMLSNRIKAGQKYRASRN